MMIGKCFSKNFSSPWKYRNFVHNSYLNYRVFVNRGISPVGDCSVVELHENVRYFHRTVVIDCKQSNIKSAKESVDKPSDIMSQLEAENEPPVSSKSKEVVKKSLWRRIVDEIKHYYHGFKLLFLDVKVAFGILNTLTKGNSLTRRERKQLVRTTADIARMLPFLIFIIVPFMELLLPLYLKFFPFMLPSTFKVESKDKEFVVQKLKAKLEIAKFLQEAIAESALVKKAAKKDDVDLATFSDFLKQVRESGLTVDTQDILRFSHLFEDEVTLESLDAKYLKALCKLLDINTLGPPSLLRFQLNMKVRQLKVDDQMIFNEGIDKIPIWELQQLCRERGMRSFGVSEERLRYQLSQWLSLNLEKRVPITLLLLSRVMYLPETLTPEEQLKQAILVLPKTVSNTAKLKVVDTDERVDHKAKFEVIKEEHEVIKKERIEAAKATKEAKVAAEAQPPKLPETLVDKAETVAVESGVVDKAPVTKVPDSTVSDALKVPTPSVQDAKEAAVSPETEISSQDMAHIESAIAHLGETKTILHKEEINMLKESQEEISKTLSSPEVAAQVTEPDVKVVKRLGNKLDKMIDEIEKTVENLDEKSIKTAQTDDIAPKVSDKSVVESIEKSEKPVPIEPKPKTERFIYIDELMTTLKKSQQSSEEKKWHNILTMLDENKDGKIEMDHLIKMIKLLSTEDIKLSNSETSKFLELLDKEAQVAETKKPKNKGNGDS